MLKNGEPITVDDTEEKLVSAVKRLWNGDWYAFARDYFELESTVYDKLHCDWVGHFDLLTKFNEGYKHFDETKDAYLEPALAAMKKLNGQGLPFEMNTGAISRGYRTAPYPNPVLLREPDSGMARCGSRGIWHRYSFQMEVPGRSAFSWQPAPVPDRRPLFHQSAYSLR